MTDTPQATPASELIPDEMELTQLETLYINKVYISGAIDGAVRMYFGEATSKNTTSKIYLSMVVTPNTLMGMKNLIDAFIDKNGIRLATPSQ
jgi:hypothetical protein